MAVTAPLPPRRAPRRRRTRPASLVAAAAVLAVLLAPGAISLTARTVPSSPVRSLSPADATPASPAPAGSCLNSSASGAFYGNGTELAYCVRPAIPSTSGREYLFSNFTAGNGTNVSAPFDFNVSWGDGSGSGYAGLSNWSSAAELVHTYNISGSYVLDLRARDAAGTGVSGQVHVVVTAPSGGFQAQLNVTQLPSGPNGSGPAAQLVWNVSGGSLPYRATIAWGDGSSQPVNGSVDPWLGGANHSYATSGPVPPAGFAIALDAEDGAGAWANATIAFRPASVTGNNTSGSRLWWITATSFRLTAWDGSLSALLNGTLSGVNASFDDLQGGGMVLGNGTLDLSIVAGSQILINTSHNASFGYFVSSAPFAVGSYEVVDLSARALGGQELANGTVAFWAPALIGPAGGGGGGGSNNSSGGPNGTGGYPTSVNVMVYAAPVTGAAPLGVAFEALLSGGSGPFEVEWTFPGANGSGRATGLDPTELYETAGWYPATAFVYNTTSAFGAKILVGIGSLWIDVLAGGTSGGSSGNNSSSTSGDRHLSAGSTDPPSLPIGLAVLAALAIGGVVGGLGGFSYASARRRRNDAVPGRPVGPRGGP